MGKIEARSYNFVHIKMNSPLHLRKCYRSPVYRKIEGEIRNFVTFITNDLTADPEISFAGDFYYPVPSHLIGKV